ncbi:aldolase [Pseudomonas oryzihabitans]|uniref:Ribulose-5-phosphate 4-epimerase/fuculose-1-phosphate aldolase n=1 Tax=Pseudomonas oryzihabitans TaxID=47885 RepID=A0AAJ2EWZ0_9PSED|nr:aldolase [Pseudomonas psychrotolerans]MDR6235288.1 ribulose-5-phosphate 4-epimerase/fuculose-1-phosphate aldolase [Pseudomonas psychrotolerans]MDR6355485.1 ribulose-5-phosphate 4-epimerase/fuculose-1-phosphate aldolase [Pseudomonas psychrotolerans]MDR6679044.1 ribulose-5-phosphate 4-epimerase/fuculose-1-phosphate aldolase [Pseudomonas psychrotolerans]
MAHAFDSTARTVTTQRDLDTPAIRQARIDLAACFRMAARLGLGEGICNHFSFVVPGHDDLFLVNPYGLAFAEVTASSLLICDFEGGVVAGEGAPEATAFYIHAQLHRLNPRARAAFHTHMPNATALCLLEGEPFVWAGQTALKFYDRLSVDEDYNGLALDYAEGERIARAAGEADVLMLKNHGPLVLGPSIAEAWDDLYYLERAAEVQLKAMASGRPLLPVAPAIAHAACQQMLQGNAESARLHLESVKRQLLRLEPDYLD